MTDAFETLLYTFPPEDLVEEDDPSYPDFEADSGCRVCASGQPCQERIEGDIGDILAVAHLPDTEKLACLEWMIRQGCSTLTRSITDMAESFSRERKQTETALIAEQNDAFRHHAGLPDPVMFHNARIEGIVVITPGIDALSSQEKAEILRLVREFNGWIPGDDPYGEHDFGVIEYKGERLFFKFDYYDPKLEYGSEHPTNLAETARVLTIMLAREYKA